MRFDRNSPVQPVSEIRKPQKISKNHFFFNNKKFEEKKMLPKKRDYPFSFPILGGRVSTRALQSSPFQISEGGSPERDGGVRRKSSCLMLCLLIPKNINKIQYKGSGTENI